ncbi:MAG: glycosyltransferase family 2 protein, partial [Bacteroidota bacterium]
DGGLIAPAEDRKKYKNLKICTIKKDQKFTHGKKLALTIGIKSSRHDILLLTDADCAISSNNWIKYMARNYQDKKEIVLGVGLYKKRKGLLNLLIRYETVFIAMQYISMAKIGKPYMGVGRNLSYKKSLFFNNRGFASHLKLESGDDDLFISEVSNKSNTCVENHPESFTWSEPETTFRNWLRQKRRHLTTGKFYQQSVKRILGLEYLSRILLFISFILLLLRFEYILFPLIVYILGLIIKSIINIIVFKGFNEKFIFLPSILIDIFIPIIYSYLHFTNYIESKRSRWQ